MTQNANPARGAVGEVADEPLVSVVIPAYNASATIAATLRSVSRQTWRHLEILVVDDGSRDDTAAIVERAAVEDPRIRLIRKPNGGVADARNVGIAASAGDFVAPIDADDLWRPEKIERQMRRLEEAGREAGVVYTLSHMIDPHDRVVGVRGVPGFDGRVSLAGLIVNYVGNGSALLMRRAALEEAGGYEPELHRRGVQGAEDYLIQFLMARRWRVACVPEHLTGYRVVPGSMSDNPVKMNRSHLAALDLIEARFPDTPRIALEAARGLYHARGVLAHLARREIGEAGRALVTALRLAPGTTVDFLVRRHVFYPAAEAVVRAVRGRSTLGGAAGRTFFEASPSLRARGRRQGALRWLVGRLRRLEGGSALPVAGEIPAPPLREHLVSRAASAV